MERKILYVDSDESSRNRFSEHLKRNEKLSVETASSIDEAVELLEEKDFNCLVSESEFPEGNAQELIVEEGPIPILFTDKEFRDVPNNLIVNFSAYVSKNTDNPYEKLGDEIDSLLESREELDYPVPDNEERRADFLKRYDIDNLVESDDFDRLAKLGSQIFDTKWCFVGLITENKERFLSFENSETEEMDRECTICTFAINEDDVMVVEDREKDPRFKYVDELEDMGIKWYAGAPMVTEEGYRIGAFCVMDTETRSFSAEERELLKLLADEAIDKLELKRQASKSIIQRLMKFYD